MAPEDVGLSISTVERETGLSKDTLRAWEKRYRFPTPGRDANRERVYSPDQVDKLIIIKRLIDRGARPGKVVALSTQELLARAESMPSLVGDSAEALGRSAVSEGSPRSRAPQAP